MNLVDELIKNGYHKFIDSFKRMKEYPENQDPYKGTYQKCVRDEKGKKYFINIEYWNFGESVFNVGKGISFSANSQLQDKMGTYNVELLSVGDKTVNEIEAWFEHHWKKNKCFYYEKKE